MNNLTYSFKKNKTNDLNNINNFNYNINDKPFNNDRYINNNTFNIINKNNEYSLMNRKINQERTKTPLNINRNHLTYHNIRNNNNYLYHKDISIRTEPSYINMDGAENLKKMYDIKDKYNNLSYNKGKIEPLDYSYYLLDNLKDNICNNYLK